MTRPLPLPPFRIWNSTLIVVARFGAFSPWNLPPAQVGWSSTLIVQVVALRGSHSAPFGFSFHSTNGFDPWITVTRTRV